MNAPQLFIVGGRLLGIYFIVSGVASISAAFFPYFYVLSSKSAMEMTSTDPSLMLLTALLHSSTWIAGGALTLRYFAKQKIDVAASSTFHSRSVLLSAIKLFGLYWLIDGLLNGLRTLFSASSISNGMTFHLMSGYLGGWGISALAGFFIICYAEKIVDVLKLSQHDS
jgi:hypothetical protein